jgi:hypothetical protein
MTFEDRTAELNASGWLINNCFQLTENNWRVSLRRKAADEFSGFGVGATPLDALNRAMKTIEIEAAALDDLLG